MTRCFKVSFRSSIDKKSKSEDDVTRPTDTLILSCYPGWQIEHTQNSGKSEIVRTMSAEYRPRFVCCRADREKGGRECTWSPPYDSHAMRCRFPPTAGGPAKTTPPFFRRTTRPSRWRRRSPKISAEVYCTYKNSVDLSASSMTNSSRNFPG